MDKGCVHALVQGHLVPRCSGNASKGGASVLDEVDRLVVLLDDNLWRVRWREAYELGILEHPAAVQHLIDRSLVDEHWLVHWQAVELLARIGDFEGCGALDDALDDEHPDARQATAEALQTYIAGLGREQRATPVLFQAQLPAWHRRNSSSSVCDRTHRSVQ